IGMNQFESRLRQIAKVMNAFRISLAHQNHEWGLVNDSLLRQCMPVRSNEATLLESLRVAVDRKNRDLGFHALQDLVSHCFRSGESRFANRLFFSGTRISYRVYSIFPRFGKWYSVRLVSVILRDAFSRLMPLQKDNNRVDIPALIWEFANPYDACFGFR